MMELGQTPPERDTPEYAELVQRIEADLGRKICGNPRKNRLKPEVNGFPCERAPKKYRLKCLKHGGQNPPPGPEHRNFKHGRYSKALGGTSLAADFKKAVTDPDLLALTREIGVLAAHLQQTLRRLNQGEDNGGRDVWITALSNAKQMKRLIRRKKPDYAACVQLADALVDIFEYGLNDFKVWDQWFSGVEALRKLVDTERKHREQSGLNLSVERAYTMLTLVSQAALNVLDSDSAGKLRTEIARLRMASADDSLKSRPQFKGVQDVN